MLTFNKTPIFVINMTQDIEKKEHMTKLCHKNNLFPIFINAVIGVKLVNNYTNNIHSFRDINQDLSASEVGCALSHINIYKQIINNKIPISLILEDDIDIQGDLKPLIEKIEKLTEDWHIIHLGHHSISSRDRPTMGSIWGKIKLSNQYKLILPCEVSGGTYGYLISYNGAKKLLLELSSLDKPIDHYTGSVEHCNLLLLHPSIIKIHHFLSDSFTSMSDRSATSYTASSSTLINLLKKVLLTMDAYRSIDTLFIKIKLSLKSVRPMNRYGSKE